MEKQGESGENRKTWKNTENQGKTEKNKEKQGESGKT